MKVTTKIEAERIAQAGSRKMAGYVLKPERGTEFLPLELRSRFYVVKPDGDRYTVNINSGTCNCPFFIENREHGVCKHTLWAKAEAAGEVRWEREALDQAEWNEYGRHDQAACC